MRWYLSLLAVLWVVPSMAQDKAGQCAAAEKAYREALVRIASYQTLYFQGVMAQPDSPAAKRLNETQAMLAQQTSAIQVLLQFMQIEQCPSPSPIPDIGRGLNAALFCGYIRANDKDQQPQTPCPELKELIDKITEGK